MHETTQRLICRLCFLLACLAPTSITAACVLARATPWYAGRVREGWEQTLRDRLGLQVLVAQAEELRPGAWLLKGVELSDPETSRRIARIRLVEAESLGGDKARLVIRLSQPELESEQMHRLWSGLERRLLMAETPLPARVEIVAGELTLQAGEGAQTFSNVQCLIESTAQRRRAICQLRLPESSQGDYVQFSVGRHSDRGRPFSEFKFDSGATHVPCGRLAAWAPLLAELGPDCRWQGVIHASDSESGWQGEFSGQLTGVDLDRLVTDRFPHKLSGQAKVVFNRAVLKEGKLTHAAGMFDARQGVVSRSLLRAAEESLSLAAAGPQGESLQTLAPYERLAFGFSISPDGLEIAGACDDVAAGVICMGQQGPLLVDGEGVVTPVVSLVRALAPASEILVPATEETDLLLRVLPSAPYVAPREQLAEPPYTPVRLHEDTKRR